jgi:hypothetical protein
VSVVAYNGRSVRTARTEALIDGWIVKITDKYVHIRAQRDGKIWIAPRYHFA